VCNTSSLNFDRTQPLSFIYTITFYFLPGLSRLAQSGRWSSFGKRVWFTESNIDLVWCDFDRASSLICGNKMPTRCNRLFLLQNLLITQHVSGTIMPIIRGSRVLYRWLLPVVLGALVFKLSVWCGAEGYVSGLRAAARKPDT